MLAEGEQAWALVLVPAPEDIWRTRAPRGAPLLRWEQRLTVLGARQGSRRDVVPSSDALGLDRAYAPASRE